MTQGASKEHRSVVPSLKSKLLPACGLFSPSHYCLADMLNFLSQRRLKMISRKGNLPSHCCLADMLNFLSQRRLKMISLSQQQ